jgi:hypothetical protein
MDAVYDSRSVTTQAETPRTTLLDPRVAEDGAPQERASMRALTERLARHLAHQYQTFWHRMEVTPEFVGTALATLTMRERHLLAVALVGGMEGDETGAVRLAGYGALDAAAAREALANAEWHLMLRLAGPRGAPAMPATDSTTMCQGPQVERSA